MELLHSNNGNNPSRSREIQTWEEVLVRLLEMIVDRLPGDPSISLDDHIEIRSLLKALKQMSMEGEK